MEQISGAQAVKLKLNIKRTLLVGLAFFSITMFWEVYDSLMPLFLYDFELSGFWRGAVMALDNLLALVLLPFMGLWSDRFPMKLRNRFGRRMPFIVCGSVLAAVLFLLVNFAHNASMLGLMMAATSFVLLCMCLYRTPAVALMPDVTPKQIRSQGNTVINIMGTIGGAISQGLIMILLKTKEVGKNDIGLPIYNIQGNNWILIAIICALMVVSTIIMIIKVKENKFVEDKFKLLKAHGIEEDESEGQKEKVSTKKALSSLSKSQLISLFLILASVFLWYMAYNGAKTHFSTFAMKVLGLDKFSLPLMIGMGAGLIAAVPASIVGKKIGRKFTILIGVLLLIAGFGLGSLLIAFAPAKVIQISMYPVFVFVGFGWTTINVHSFVMSVEMASENTTGAFTGLYYTFAMAAQIITPMLAGVIMEWNAKLLMVYALIFSVFALITMFFVKHGNAKDGSPDAAAPIIKTDAASDTEENN